MESKINVATNRLGMQSGDMQNEMSESEQETAFSLFDDIQSDATTGTNTQDKEVARKMLQSILQSCSELQTLLG